MVPLRLRLTPYGHLLCEPSADAPETPSPEAAPAPAAPAAAAPAGVSAAQVQDLEKRMVDIEAYMNNVARGDAATSTAADGGGVCRGGLVAQDDRQAAVEQHGAAGA